MIAIALIVLGLLFLFFGLAAIDSDARYMTLPYLGIGALLLWAAI